MRAEPATISIRFEDGKWRIMATSYARTVRAGERLFRAAPWPQIQFAHDDEEAALKDANTLTSYLDACNKRTKISRAAIRAFGE